ncbi:uncharacterized protein LOC121106872 isoform X2 [Gallus gallus]|uniref:uncharacterized protein LOC121106872 isoform X2 n=1 Tax=Gallus gallus TaxID=9031 RepID=UPI001F01757E|nr:uncharacterized protein LOC121106872 isoform X2 [Gallus gallus]
MGNGTASDPRPGGEGEAMPHGTVSAWSRAGQGAPPAPSCAVPAGGRCRPVGHARGSCITAHKATCFLRSRATGAPLACSAAGLGPWQALAPVLQQCGTDELPAVLPWNAAHRAPTWGWERISHGGLNAPYKGKVTVLSPFGPFLTACSQTGR